MTTTRIKVLNNSVRRDVRPKLTAIGFKYDSASRTFRRPRGNCTQIINFQAGVRSHEGRFTVNLGAYHPTYRENSENSPPPERPKAYDCLLQERLSVFRDTLITRVGRHFISEPNTFIKWWLVTPSDYWWRFSEDPAVTDSAIRSVLKILLPRGLNWLDDNCNEESLRAKYAKQRRVRTNT